MAEDLKPSPDKIPEGAEKLEECQKQRDEYLAGWQRSRADLLNYKKEEMERIAGLMAYAQDELILKILPVLDNFDLAEKNLPKETKADENIKGILQIKSQLSDFLKSHGLEEIKTVGIKFDPNWHEVVSESEAKGKDPGLIVEEIQKGYKINGRLLRPAKVKINK